MSEKLLKKENKLSVIGLGYVGLPIALEFAKELSVIGFDINKKRVDLMKKGIDPSKELSESDFANSDIQFTSEPEDLKKASFHIVAVPTPIDKNNLPDLRSLISASEIAGKVIKKGDYVVFESTVFPGATEEICIPAIEKMSGLKFLSDFKVGYSPERINPGDKVHTLTNVVKITSGCDEESSEEIAKVYEHIIKAGIHRASSIKVAEAAKIIENTQRDLNIALMNELSIIFHKMNINTYDVLKAAGTKWNFLNFYPGLVGGHCIGVDPYYLTFKANELGHFAQVITAGRSVNDGMSKFITTELVKRIIRSGINVLNSRILVMGITFKENVSDIRNSKVADVIFELQSYGMNVEVIDPFADAEEVKKEYGLVLKNRISAKYDAIVLAVAHSQYSGLSDEFFKEHLNKGGIVFDIKGLYKELSDQYTYMSL
ncbi:MAG: nucleotide sugar dehydrogenase [Bacteroidales bacterium]|nr:nucleotide sugar dehydrogenase [Bacteroidales bacterium]